MKALIKARAEDRTVDTAKRISAKCAAQQMVEQNMDQAVLIMRQWLWLKGA